MGVDNPDISEFAAADSLAEGYTSYHAKLNYLAAPKLSIGGEVMCVDKKLENGNDGDMTRVQFAVEYAF